MNTTLTLNRRKHWETFARIKRLMACRSKDPERQVLQHVLIESTGKSSMVTATNGIVLRRDRIWKPMVSGIYGVTIDTRESLRLEWLEDVSRYPLYKHVIPDLKKGFYIAEGIGPSFVYWAAAAFGTYINSDLINVGNSEEILLYVPKHGSKVPVIAKNRQSTLVIMPLNISSKEWQASLRSRDAGGYHGVGL